MKLAFSNIAWSPENSETIYDRLGEAGVTGLEIAPSLFFPNQADPFLTSKDDCTRARARLEAHRLVLCSMQSLLFGVEGASLFGSVAERGTFRKATTRAIALAGRLGGLNVVFGSPLSRSIPRGMDPIQARIVWHDELLHLGDVAQKADSVLALETNPSVYGTNFMTTLAETRAVAEALDHPSVRINLDLGALILTGEAATLESWVPAVLPLVSHVHLSAPELAPITSEEVYVRRLVSALGRAGYDGWLSVEMRPAEGALGDALRFVETLVG